jgi:cysteine desulfurase
VGRRGRRLTAAFGNVASRNQSFDWDAETVAETAHRQVSKLINPNAREIIFTSRTTESDNLAVKGMPSMHGATGNHIITVTTEHSTVLDTYLHLEEEGSTLPICRLTARVDELRQ